MLILDITSTNQGAYRLLRKRVLAVSKTCDNYIVCPMGEYTTKMQAEGIKLIHFPQSRRLGLSLISEIKALHDILLETRPDIVHSHNSKSGAVARIATHFYNRKASKKIVAIHQVHGFHFNACSGLKQSFYRFAEIWLARWSDELLFQNKHEMQQATDLGLARHARLTYLGNGINAEVFRRKNHIPDQKTGPVNIICVARIEPIKNQIMLAEVARLLAEDDSVPDFKFILIGESDPNYLLQLTGKIRQYGLAQHFQFAGKLDIADLLNIMHEADLNVLPSIKEGKPRALMESQMFGIPCIATDVVGSNEVIIDGKTGILVPLNDVKAMADAVREMIFNPERAKAYVESGREYASQHFDEDNVVRRLLSIYDEYGSKTGVSETTEDAR